MKRTFLFLALLSAAMNAAQAQQFDDYYDDRTLRLDYTFSGDSERQELYVDELVALPRWYGKRRRLAEVPLKGNGQLTVGCSLMQFIAECGIEYGFLSVTQKILNLPDRLYIKKS